MRMRNADTWRKELGKLLPCISVHLCAFVPLLFVYFGGVYRSSMMCSHLHPPLLAFSGSTRCTGLYALGAIVYATAPSAAISYLGSFTQCWHVLGVRKSGVCVH